MPGRHSFHLREEGERAFGYAQAVTSGDTVYISGMLAVDDQWQVIAPGDMAAQVKAVYAALGTTLARLGVGFADVVKEGIFVTDMDGFIAANDIRKAAYAGLALPAATAVEVRRLAFSDCLVEIELTAVKSR